MKHFGEDAAARDATLAAGCRRASSARASTPAIFSATYDSIVVERSAGPRTSSTRCRRRGCRASDVVREAAVGVGVAQAEDVQPEEVLGDHRRVRLELADPPAAWVLELEQRGWSPSRPPGRAGSAPRRRSLGSRPRGARRRCGPPPPSSRASRRRSTRRRGRCSPWRSASAQRRLRVPGRAAKVACGSRETRDQRSSARPSRSVSASAIASTRLLPRISSRSGTPLETTVRYWPPSGGRWPVSAPRSKTQCAGESSSAASRWREDRPVEEQVDADDRRVLERGRLLAEQAGGLGRRARRRSRRRRRGRRGTRRATRAGRSRRARGRPRRRASRRAARPAGAGRRRAGRRSSAVLHGEHPVVGAGLGSRQVQRRPDEDVPEAVDLLSSRAAEHAPRTSVRDRRRGQTPQPQVPPARSGAATTSGRCE